MRESGRTKAMLCELVIVALFLALSAVTLLRLFAVSNNVSRESAALTRANILAQDALERFTAGEELPQREEYAFEGETYAVLSEIQTEVGDAGVLEECKVTVLSDEETLLEMRTSRYRPERSAS
ncbi:MAG TPA: hypothetical protein IAB20_02105 [Candidatus Pullichristensenella excrementipullorum]|nr:hypothetical protein [Candidatus Pullichristensenella excrementipullorum]